MELLEARILGFAHSAYSDLHEALTRFSLLVAQARAIGEKLLHRTHDGIVNLRVVPVEPFAEIFVAFELKTRNRARPVEPRAAVVTVLGIRQQQVRLQDAI